MIPQKAIDLILEAEGVDQPSKWPGGASGITLGYGYDLGYESSLEKDWSGILPADHVARLKRAVGRRGQRAQQIAHSFAGIRVTRQQALKVFQERTLPKYEAETLVAFPGLEKMSANVRGALVSVVFNRGASMTDDPARPKTQTRREMRSIREAVLCGNPLTIARNLRAMKRLWAGKNLNGLLRRRDAEADLVLQTA